MAKFSKPDGTLFTQISSGIYRGKKLALPALSSTRSTKSIVKGSFFDTWRAELRDAVFIECFGGSGAMALEALSNGAKNVYAIEKNVAAHKIMRKNFKLFGLGANAILGDCFERLPEILHELQADINGRSDANSPNLSGKNFKNHANDVACYENLGSEKESCRKSFSSVEQGENGYRAAQGIGAESDTQSGVKNLAKCGTRSSMSDRAQNGAQSGANGDCAGAESFDDCAQIGDYASASSIKYCVNSLATDAASFSKKFDASSASKYDASDAETANRSVNLSSKCSESSNFDTNRGVGLDVSCEEKEILNLGENFNASYGENLHSNANFIYDSRKNSTANSIENSVFDPARRVFVYLDPPFAIRQGFGGIYERMLALIARLGSAQFELLIAIEHMSELGLPLKIGDFVLLKSRKFGATTMSYYAK
ncbi:RsmD family RNA methyltransferase [uncultured Campylobacter sp.]|uniref:RsmD family RNA methyltransferase n=1 Tax=uncultured Campylobacter sp. TaxID=218934 RepID=UPI002605D6AB|nr:RsmD family RNA methyltransferase [uncultured Campylobacter sp.]